MQTPLTQENRHSLTHTHTRSAINNQFNMATCSSVHPLDKLLWHVHQNPSHTLESKHQNPNEYIQEHQMTSLRRQRTSPASTSHVNLIEICNNGITFCERVRLVCLLFAVSFVELIFHGASKRHTERESVWKSNVNRHRYHTKNAIHSIQRCVNGIFVCYFFLQQCFSKQNEEKRFFHFCFETAKENFEIRDFFNTLMRIYLAFVFVFVFAAHTHIHAFADKKKLILCCAF